VSAETPGAGKEAERRYRPPLRLNKRHAPALSEPPLAEPCCCLSLVLERPTGRARPQGGTVRRPGIRFSGFEGEGATQGDVSRPERSAGRVTATDIENDRPRLPVSDEGGDRQPSGPPWRSRRSVRGFAARSRLRKNSPRTGASEQSEVAPGAGNGLKITGGPRQSARSACLPTARNTKKKRPSGASAGFMRSRSRPQRPRTGSPNAVRSAGTGQKRSTKCRRGGPVAAQRSSGRHRRQGGRPTGADGCGKPGGRRGGAQRSEARP